MNTDIRAAVITIRSNKVLLVEEATPIIYGLWNWQQGKVEENESVESAAIRETYEETAFDINIIEKIEVIGDPFPGTKELHVFLGEIVGGELKINPSETLQAKWFAKSDLEEIKDNMKPYAYRIIRSILK